MSLKHYETNMDELLLILKFPFLKKVTFKNQVLKISFSITYLKFLKELMDSAIDNKNFSWLAICVIITPEKKLHYA